KSNSASRRHKGLPLEIENLESRLVPTASVSLTSGVLAVSDTSAANVEVTKPASGPLQIILLGDTFARPAAALGGLAGFTTNTLIATAALTGLSVKAGGSITVTPFTSITLSGAISLTGQGTANSGAGVTISSASLNASSVSLTGTGAPGAGSYRQGV